MQQISFTVNRKEDGKPTMFFIFQEAKKSILNFSEGTVKVLQLLFRFNIILVQNY